LNKETIDLFIQNAIAEDLGNGDHTSLATIPADATGSARLIIKDNGVLAGVALAEAIFKSIDTNLLTTIFLNDGAEVKYGDVALTVKGNTRSILLAERLVLNCMQRMSGIATKTNRIVKLLEPFKAQVLDTRKTTPGIRFIEKWAVRIGGGVNHRIGLYDMILIKDNHVDYAGGIANAIHAANKYIKETGLNLEIEIEVRNFPELDQVLATGQVNRIMLDNFTIEDLKEAVRRIGDQYTTEASGGILESNIADYAACGVDFVSMGALTHSVKSLDMSLKAF
jgi:nicotinate-nucleotide pyrophosphorylase (carboxylating)